MGWMVVATPYTIPETVKYMEVGTHLLNTIKLIAETTVTRL